ncbi:MAG TPA: glycosyltransferase family 1 protein, partial [Terriglobales bacterium]|nr:glycosyltransferase family 1 protein [Terriglobales bacterium]
GVERYVTEICRGLSAIKSNHRFLIARPPLGAKILRHAWEHICLPVLCLKESADLLFCPANIAPLVPPPRVRLVVTVHGLAFRYYPDAYTKGFGYYYSYVLPRVLHNADAILAVSRMEKESILDQYRWIDQRKVFAIHSGINHDFFKVGEKQRARETLRRRFGISGKFVLSVGPLTAIKNVTRLVDAYLQIANRTDSKLVLVCGVGPYRYETTERISDPRVMVVRYVDQDLPQFYQAAELTIVTSKYEGFGFPALEAMACGCPVVVSNVAALPEVCGEAALYVDPDDTQSIADTMLLVLNNENLRCDLIERGFCRVKKFTWEKTVGDILEVFEEILGER